MADAESEVGTILLPQKLRKLAKSGPRYLNSRPVRNRMAWDFGLKNRLPLVSACWYKPANEKTPAEDEFYFLGGPDLTYPGPGLVSFL